MWGPVFLTLKLALATVFILLLISTPLAWWLSRTRTRLKPAIESVIGLPIVLPPTVLGFYLLLLLGPKGWIGETWVSWTGDTLTFSFTGLLIASILYSLPFALQPLQSSFEQTGTKHFMVARTLGAGPLEAFLKVVCPMSMRGFITAGVLSFAHTLGEFGVVLMVGGNIPGKTRVLSIAIYDHVEAFEYQQAHILSASLLIFSFLLLFFIYYTNRKLAWMRFT